MSWLDWSCLFDWLTEWMNPIYRLKSKYLMVADFMTYYTRTKISHGCRFHEILHQNKNIQWFHEILHQSQNISWLQISWDITPESKYLMVADFMRYYTRIKISHGCRFHEILHQNQNITIAYFVRYYTRIQISHG